MYPKSLLKTDGFKYAGSHALQRNEWPLQAEHGPKYEGYHLAQMENAHILT